jgi:tetratricopeptide (TPR) repeat protein
MVDDGRTDDEIRSVLVARFGEDIDYTPGGEGLTGLVWVLPVLAGGAAAVGLGLALVRWRGGRSGGRPPRPLVVGGVLLVVVVAGLLVARTAGQRPTGGSLSGDIRSSTRTLLVEAGVADPEEAVVLYSQVLEVQPSNAEALAYRGWVRWRNGEGPSARSDLDEAVAVDPAYPDVRVFRASQRHADGDHTGAAADLIALDGLAAPPIVGDLLAASRLRERIAVGLASDGDLLEALEVLDSGLSADPENSSLLAERGWLLVLTRTPELVQRGLSNLDEAVAVQPGDPHARAYRAVALATVVGRPGDATADLAAFAAIDDPPADLVDLLVGMGLLGG